MNVLGQKLLIITTCIDISPFIFQAPKGIRVQVDHKIAVIYGNLVCYCFFVWSLLFCFVFGF